MRGMRNDDNGASELIGTMILLVIAVSVISVIIVNAFSVLTVDEQIYVEMLGKIEMNNVIFEHQGGDNLGLDTEIYLEIGGR